VLEVKYTKDDSDESIRLRSKMLLDQFEASIADLTKEERAQFAEAYADILSTAIVQDLGNGKYTAETKASIRKLEELDSKHLGLAMYKLMVSRWEQDTNS
jgi:hypothetical protein